MLKNRHYYYVTSHNKKGDVTHFLCYTLCLAMLHINSYYVIHQCNIACIGNLFLSIASVTFVGINLSMSQN